MLVVDTCNISPMVPFVFFYVTRLNPRSLGNGKIKDFPLPRGVDLLI